jgi:hypothetical protein
MLAKSTRLRFEDALPRRNIECDVWSLDLDPFEAFVLSSIDGGTEVVELAEIVGAPLADTQRTLARLIALGAVQLVERAPRGDIVPTRIDASSDPASADLGGATAPWHSARL